MPKVELTDIRLGVSPLTDTVYAGVLDPKDKTQSTWKHHHDVNADFYKCLVQLLSEQDGGKLELRVRGELRHTITITSATPQEIAAHKEAEVERKRKEDESMPIEFGTRIAPFISDFIWEIACHNPSKSGLYIATREDEHVGHISQVFKRSEFTIITSSPSPC